MALALGDTVHELKIRVPESEKRDWQRFFQIYGPVGDRRLDEHYAYLRQAIVASYASKPPTVEECRLEYDYRRCFPKEAATEIERILRPENVDKDIATILALGKRLKKAEKER